MKFNNESKTVKETEEIVIDGAVMHKIVKGDTIESIAEEHGVAEKDIRDFNRRDILATMQVGQLIRIK